jgi:hypothetical protein
MDLRVSVVMIVSINQSVAVQPIISRVGESYFKIMVNSIEATLDGEITMIVRYGQ